MKDYYDLYLFDKIQPQNINFELLKKALLATSKQRGTESLLPSYRNVILRLRESPILKQRWEKYRLANVYSDNISYEDTCDAVLELVKNIGI